MLTRSQKALMLICCVIATFLTSINVYSQPTSLSIKTIATTDGNDITLRWAPLDYETWAWGNEHGYRVERVTIEENSQPLSQSAQMASFTVLVSNLKPLPENDWEGIADTSDIAGVAAGAIYGESFDVQDPDSLDIVSFYNVNLENENRFGFSLFAADQSFEIAKYMGLGFVDTSAVQGSKYIYGVTVMGDVSGITVHHGMANIATDDNESLPAPFELVGEPGDLKASLSWNTEGIQGNYTSYIIERSSDNGATFSQINDNPLINTTKGAEVNPLVYFIDSLAANGQKYIYRVRGRTPFGTLGPASDTIHVEGKPMPLGINPYLFKVKEIIEGSLTLDWDFPSEFNSNIQGFEVYRSQYKDSTFQKINTGLVSSSLRQYIDENPLSVNYYIIKAIDENDYPLSSFPALGQLNDETPPDAPQGVNCISNNSGVVTVSWEANTEEDIMGYRVFMSNQPDGNYSQVTSFWTDKTSWQHQINLNSLSKEVYYKVLSLDYRENYSELSEYCIVERPDIIPPAAPHLVKVDPTLSGVLIEWKFSSSEDVIKHVLERKLAYDISWRQLYEINQQNTDTIFIDTTASYKYLYDYRLLAYDEADLVTSSVVLQVQPIDNGLREKVVINPSTTVVSSAQGLIDLSWQYPYATGLDDFIIYRKMNQHSYLVYKTIKLDDGLSSGSLPNNFSDDIFLNFNFEDKEVEQGNTYEYSVIARFTNGAMSEMSSPITINF